MRAYKRRMIWVALGIAVLAISSFFVIRALQDNLVFFLTPTQVLKGETHGKSYFRMGGIVLPGSLKRSKNGVDVDFVLSDGKSQIPVVYQGALPDLFKEGKGALVEGEWSGNLFQAKIVLAKHDENYVPPNMKSMADSSHQSVNSKN